MDLVKFEGSVEVLLGSNDIFRDKFINQEPIEITIEGNSIKVLATDQSTSAIDGVGLVTTYLLKQLYETN